MPTFSETEVDKYFLHFEKIANSLKWPKESWTLLLQSSLIGKVREIYSALSVEESCQFEVVKAAVLKVYELVPEAYRQKFRDSVKRENQTFVGNKETLFDRWCSSKDICGNYEKLRQLMLIEEFKKCLPSEIKTYIDEKKVDTLNQAAVMADDYILTHKASIGKPQVSSTLNKNVEPFYPHNDGQQLVYPRVNTKNLSRNSRYHLRQRPPLPAGPECFHCHRRGHVMADCWHLKGNYQGSPKPTMTTVKSRGHHGQETQSTMDNCLCDEYKPFLSQGYVCLPGSASKTPITILRDTGANQSLLLESTVPLTETFTGTEVLIQGVELEPIKVPLHEVELQSDIVTGLVRVGVRPSLPVEGISLILGNDLAGGRVTANPCVTIQPTIPD